MAGTIGRFEIEREIGRGSMGIVYLARDPRVRRPVALKTYHFPEGLAREQQAEYRARFLREAQAAGALSHPGIVTVYDVDEDPESGLPFIAMEYVPGRSLQRILAEGGPIEPRRAVAMHLHLADALHAAHLAGVVHRDIKPANILVREPDGAVKIADFGVARLATSTLTRTGETIGTPAYMSPEQVKSAPMDGRADLFSLAVILYECLAGERPFSGEDLAAIVYSVVHETHRPATKLSPALPAGLDAFFDRALAKDPAGRFQDGAAFRRGLEEAMSAEAPPLAERTIVAAAPLAESTLAPAAPLAASPAQVVAAAPAEGPPLPPPPSSGTPPPPPLPLLDGAAWRALPVDVPVRRRPRAPRDVWVAVLAAGVALAGLGLLRGGGAAPSATGEPVIPAHLRLEGTSRVAEGTLTIKVDGDTVLTRPLSLPRVGPKFLGDRRPRFGRESFEAEIPVAPGRHKLVARVDPEEGSDFTGRTSLELGPGQTLTLRLDIGKVEDRTIALGVD